jgi:hypothetical protein
MEREPRGEAYMPQGYATAVGRSSPDDAGWRCFGAVLDREHKQSSAGAVMMPKRQEARIIPKCWRCKREIEALAEGAKHCYHCQSPLNPPTHWLKTAQSPTVSHARA